MPAVAVLLAAALLTAPAPSKPALTCDVSTAPGSAVTFTPAVGLLPRTVRVKAVLNLGNCRHGATMTIDGTVHASCAGGWRAEGGGRIEWFGRKGGVEASSTVELVTSDVATANPADILFNARVTKGRLKGAKIGGSATPTSETGGCALTGLRSVTGVGMITFTR
ncbi:hypothetical protein [Herbidospora mongoliensis]|uniref:hypothetical protein n=1 Tax=Herbidospora mongoliensis TaxID=688067 RepID=UPI0008332AA9|nr:hypothetical protein [Herbidospora mongoliensis]